MVRETTKAADSFMSIVQLSSNVENFTKIRERSKEAQSLNKRIDIA